MSAARGGHEGHGQDHDHDHDGDDHDHEGHDHDHALIVDRLPAGTWRVDPDGSEILFKARSLFGLLPVSGVFERFTGEMNVDESGLATGKLLVEPGSVDTGLARRDSELRGPRYFNVEEYPLVSFTLESVEPSGEDHLNVTGTLEVCDKEIPIIFTAYAIAHGDHLHLEGRVVVDHDIAGLGWAKPGMVSKKVRAEAALTLTQAG